MVVFHHRGAKTVLSAPRMSARSLSGNKNGLICSRRDARARERERFHGFLFPKEVLIREALALEVIPPRSLGANLAGGHSASCFLFRDGTDGH